MPWLLACVAAPLPAASPGTSVHPVVPLDHLPALKGDHFVQASPALGRSFHVDVRYPEGYAAAPTSRSPVVYLLYGDSLFPILAATHLFLHDDDALPEAVVVGIAYGGLDPAVNRRGLDFSPPAADAGEGQGGADAFLALLRTELLPEVERRYRVDPARRVLVGQRRGGQVVLYSAFVDPDLFWGRIASNPAFHPGHERLFRAPAAATRHDLGLVVASGGHDRPPLREAALAWFDAWRGRDAPWALHAITIPGGTHAADIGNSDRAGMRWLFADRGDAPSP